MPLPLCPRRLQSQTWPARSSPAVTRHLTQFLVLCFPLAPCHHRPGLRADPSQSHNATHTHYFELYFPLTIADLARALIPRSVTVALALPIATQLDAPLSITAAAVLLQGG